MFSLAPNGRYMALVGGNSHSLCHDCLILLDSFIDPFDSRWQGPLFERAALHLISKSPQTSQYLSISRWFDPPFISPRQEAVALPLSLTGMLSAFSVVCDIFTHPSS